MASALLLSTESPTACAAALTTLLSNGRTPAPLRSVRMRLASQPNDRSALIEACAAAHRACRATLGCTPYPSQWLAAFGMLGGSLVEMSTGEGKTLALALAATIAALAGRRVHLMTANDYLVARDAQALRPLYQALGLRVDTVTAASTATERRLAYRQDIVYATAREIVFDTLRDAQAGSLHEPSLRQHVQALSGTTARQALVAGYDVALIDEADSILLDEAQMPFVLSQPVDGGASLRTCMAALSLARSLRHGTDFKPDDNGAMRLSDAGRVRLGALPAQKEAGWLNRMHREEMVERALFAMHALHAERDYLVRNGQVILIDKFTARAAPGRVWSQGLHELVTVKEGCRLTQRSEVVSQLTYPEFFPRYAHRCGISGTLAEDARELKRLYGLRVMALQPHCAPRRQVLPSRIFGSSDARWQAVVQRAAELAAVGRPVLIGTDSVEDSEALAAHFCKRRHDVVVLNAAHDQHEADIVAQAGLPGRITVATNMAGRGTDIALAPGVAEAGGLHVICCQDNRSRRLDRQLAGRCARRGEPGSFEAFRLWRDAGLTPGARPSRHRLHRIAAAAAAHLPHHLVELAFRERQRRQEAAAARERQRQASTQRQADEHLRFAWPAQGGTVASKRGFHR